MPAMDPRDYRRAQYFAEKRAARAELEALTIEATPADQVDQSTDWDAELRALRTNDANS